MPVVKSHNFINIFLRKSIVYSKYILTFVIGSRDQRQPTKFFDKSGHDESPAEAATAFSHAARLARKVGTKYRCEG